MISNSNDYDSKSLIDCSRLENSFWKNPAYKDQLKSNNGSLNNSVIPSRGNQQSKLTKSRQKAPFLRSDMEREERYHYMINIATQISRMNLLTAFARGV